MSKIAHAAVEALREHGYAVVVIAPDDLEGIDPEIIEKRMRETHLNVINEQGINEYLVTHYEDDPEEDQQFICKGTDINDVIEKFEEQFPGNTIQGVELQ